MIKHSLKCSFCRRREDEVARLVAGPRVYICDRCAAIATELMQAPVDPDGPGARARQGALRTRVAGWRRRWFGVRRGSRQLSEVATW